jgi:flagellar biosynthesis protein FlhG
MQIKHQIASQTASADHPVSAPRVISVTSGKGGVGKTNIVGNLAMAFSRLGKKVLVLDADLGLANIDILFGLHPIYNLGHVISGEKQLAEIMVNGPEGIRIIPAGSGLEDLTRLTEGQKLNLLGEFEALRENLDILLVDTGAGISSNVMYFNLAADECIVVATDEPTSITDAYAMIKVMATKYNTKHFKLLINMVKTEAQAKAVYQNLSQAADRFLQGVVIEYTGYVPHDDLVKKAVISQKPVFELFPYAEASRRFGELAKDLLAADRRHDSDGNIKFFLKRFIDFRTAESLEGKAEEIQ